MPPTIQRGAGCERNTYAMNHYADTVETQDESQPEPLLTTSTETASTTNPKTSKPSAKRTTTKKQAEKRDSAAEIMQRWKMTWGHENGRRILNIPSAVPERIRTAVYAAIRADQSA